MAMAQTGYVVAHDGTEVKVKPETICVHGDTPTAVVILQKIRESLKTESIAVKPTGK